MFQRFPEHEGYSDPQLANFYGMALPLLKRGVPVKTVHMENLSFPETLSGIKVLSMTYSNMKPLDPQAHTYLAEWVKNGGNLIFNGSDLDPFQNIEEWWSTGDNHFTAPSQHLFTLLGLDPNAKEGQYKVGKGTVSIIRKDPKEYIMNEGGEAPYLTQVEALYADKGAKLEYKNDFVLDRGPYTLMAVVDESISDKPLQRKGSFIDLFDPTLPVKNEIIVNPGQQALVIDLAKVADKKRPQVLAASFREDQEKSSKESYSFVAKSPENTNGISRVLLPKMPKQVLIDGKDSINPSKWDNASKTYLVEFENSPEGVNVEFIW